VVVLLAAALAGCETVDKRIQRNQELFGSYPPQTRELIRAGKVEVGFTMDQARMALGRPDRVVSERTADSTREVWAYGAGASAVGFGFGMGGWGMSHVGTSVAFDTVVPDEWLRLTFVDGRVAGIKRRSP